MKLIVGLGNPGARYEHTKHNIGFRVIDTIYDKIKSENQNWQPTTKRATSVCQSLVMQAAWKDLPVTLAKPMTYMNNSGVAVAALVNRLDLLYTDVCIIYDDIHLDVGVIRIRQKGSDGGQKGMKSIIYHLDSNEFPRLRIGIGEPVGNLTDYVLSTFTEDEKVLIDQSVDRAVEAVETFITKGVLTTMNQFNSRQ
ncbi:aminoacyl-tRNA hydrolase [Candidatus Poribacteria bacterium]|nr:aminoacyl-tRNA hydrolase [Candidatus Poribacteria bacterium]